MKNKILVFAASLCAAAVLCSCGASVSDASVSDIFSAAKSCSSDFEELVDVEDSDLKYLFEVDNEWFSEYSAAVSGNPAYAEEIAVFKASSSDNAKKIKEALEARVESRKKVLESYAPDEFSKLEKARITIKDDYVYLIVGKDNKAADDAVKKLFK